MDSQAQQLLKMIQSGNAPSGLKLDLRSDHLWNNDLCLDSINALANVLQSGNAPSGLTLTLWNDYEILDGINALANALQSGNAPSGLTLNLLGNNFPSLSIPDNPWNDHHLLIGIKALANALQSGHAPSGLTLNLLGNNLPSVSIADIANALQSGNMPIGLRLGLGLNNFDSAGATVIANALQSGSAPAELTLDLAYNNIGSNGAIAIANALQSGSAPSRLTLNLSYNNVGSNGITAITNALQSGNTPAELALNLRGNDLGPAGATTIANALQSGNIPTGLTLGLRDNDFGSNGTTAIANALQSGNAPTRLTLNLAHNNIGLDGATAIANALQSGNAPTGLTLNLDDNNLGPNNAIIAIANALQSGNAPTGLTLNLKHNLLRSKDIITIANALRSGNVPIGLTLDLRDNQFHLNDIIAIISAITAFPIAKRHQLHVKIKEADHEAQRQINTLCYFEPLIWPSLVFRCMWATAPDDHPLKKLPLELVHQILSYMMEEHHPAYQKIDPNEIEAIWAQINELRYCNPRNYPSHPVHVSTISLWSSYGRTFYLKGYLATVKPLIPNQYLSASIHTRELASKQIISAIASTLAEYNIIWKRFNEKETTRTSFCQLSHCLKAIKDESKSLEAIVDDILLFFRQGSGHWHAGKKNNETGTYSLFSRPSIKTLLMKKLLTISLFDRKINSDGTLTLITQTELEKDALQYTLDLTQDKFGGCYIPGLICFFENECKRVAGLKKPVIREEEQKRLLS